MRLNFLPFICCAISGVCQDNEINRIPIHQFEIRSTGLCKVDVNQLPLPADFNRLEQMLLQFPPHCVVGNHRHLYFSSFSLN
ncbi:MAG TPA: hypothetical protein VLG76_04805 [Rhabdochlamydiaceae bacterium]|nr:hypothetical protein [Rhabdochlamydiaceae bacterium]